MDRHAEEKQTCSKEAQRQNVVIEKYGFEFSSVIDCLWDRKTAQKQVVRSFKRNDDGREDGGEHAYLTAPTGKPVGF